MVHNTAPEAGTAAPTPAAVALPIRSLGFVNAPAIAVAAVAAGQVLLGTHVGQVPRGLTPAEARLLAVYLVDCANALDNPAARVIADTTEDVANVYPWHPANFEGEGIGHE